MHHNRHKEILRIVRQISALDIDQLGSILPPGKASHDEKGRRESTTTISTGTGTATDTASESTGMEEAKLTRRERKKSKKNGNSTPKARRDVESFPMEELDFVSEALHLSVHESKGAWQGTYVYDHKQESFDARCAIEEEEPQTPESEMTSSVHDLAVRAPTGLTPRQRKTLKKYMPPINHSSYGGGSRKFSPHALLQDATDPFNGVDPAIFFRLGVEIVNPVKNSKARKDLVAKLVAAVKEDIEIITREDKETEMREAGFWRWAGKTAWHVMKETRRTLDWATGQKINDPRPGDVVEDDIGIGFAESDIDKPKLPEPETPDLPRTKREAVVEESSSPSPNWKTVLSKKSGVASKKKVKRGPTTTLTFNNFNSRKLFDPVKEEAQVDEECDDMNEMLTRYQQQISGERNVGSGSRPATPDHRKMAAR